MQADSFNRSRIQTVVAVALTSTTHLEAAPGNVLLSRRESGLSKPSVANVSQLVTLDKAFLARRVRALPAASLEKVEAGVRLVLSL